MFYRLKRLFAYPVNLLRARLAPSGYARSIGVNVKGSLTIYGSSYDMFSSEPFLVTLGDNVFISVGAKFVCHDGGVLPFRRQHPTFDLAAPIAVGDNCFIGMGAVILKGVTIGDDCIVGAYAVVTRDVPDGHIVAGNPARVVKRTENYIAEGLQRSLGIGHLSGSAKEQEYRRIFAISDR